MLVLLIGTHCCCTAAAHAYHVHTPDAENIDRVMARCSKPDLILYVYSYTGGYNRTLFIAVSPISLPGGGLFIVSPDRFSLSNSRNCYSMYIFFNRRVYRTCRYEVHHLYAEKNRQCTYGLSDWSKNSKG